MDTLTANDELLIHACLEGDGRAFGTLYQRHMLSIYRYLLARIGDVQDAEDLTENVFLKVWQALPRYQAGKASFRTWLYRIAHNTLVDHYRTRRVCDELTEDRAALDPGQPAGTGNDPSAGG